MKKSLGTRVLGKYMWAPIIILEHLGAYYACPKGKDGKRLGHLVGFAAKYKDPSGKMKQYVGDVYVNFSIAEQYPEIMHHYADLYVNELRFNQKDILKNADVICGPQMGGISIAQMVALVLKKRFAYIEKKVTAVAKKTSREAFKLLLLRHTINRGENVLIMEDVVNNFSTTRKAIRAIEKAGGKVIAIGSLLNRSGRREFRYKNRSIPVISLLDKQISQWKQHDPAVRDDIKRGMLILKPKDNWKILRKDVEKEMARIQRK